MTQTQNTPAPEASGRPAPKKLDKSRVEITASIPVETWESYRSQALNNINQTITIDGFRKGMIPENILVAKVGEMAVLEEMAELAISKSYIDLIIEHKLDAIGKPEIKVTKIAKGNPLEFTATTAIVPEVDLPDYKKLASKAVSQSSPDEEKVTEKDIEDAIVRVRKAHASHEGHDHAKMSPEEHEKAIEANMPELSDDFVKGLGGGFTDVADFRSKLEVMLARDKKEAAEEKRRIRIADAISDATKVEMPDIMVESEVERIQSQFQGDIERMGVKLDDYLKHAKKTIDDLRNEWRPHAEKKAKLQLILNSIASKENIKPSQKEIEEEVSHILEHYKDADRERASVYAETVLTNEKVFQFLEKADK